METKKLYSNTAWNLWSASFLLWVGCTLSFMAAMSISSALFALGALFFCSYNINLRKVVLESAFFKITILFMFVACMSWLHAWISPPLGIEITHIKEIKKFTYLIHPVLIAWAVIIFSHRQKVSITNLKLWNVLLYMSLFMGVLGIIQFWGGYLFTNETLAPFGRFFRWVANSRHAHAQGLMFFHLSFASSISFSYCYILARCLWPMESDDKKKRVFLVASAVLIGITLFYTYSRIAWITLGFVSVFLFFLRKPLWSFLILIAFFVSIVIYWNVSHDFRMRFQNATGWHERVVVWKASTAMFQDRPYFGVGFAKTGNYSGAYSQRVSGEERKYFSSHAHNNFLDILAATGSFGFAAYFLWWASLLFYAVKTYRWTDKSQKWLPAALIAGGLAFQINGLTQVNFFDAKSQHAMVLWAGLVLAVYWQKNKAIKYPTSL